MVRAGQVLDLVQGVALRIAPAARACCQAHRHARAGGGIACRVQSKPARQCVSTAKARQDVVAAVAGNHVGQRVARPIDRSRPQQRQVFYIPSHLRGARQAERHRALDRVRASTTRLVDNVARGVHYIGVIASATHHGVIAGTTIDAIVSAKTRDRVVAA